MTFYLLTGVITNIVIWIEKAYVLSINHVGVPYLSVFWIMQDIIQCLRQHIRKSCSNLQWQLQLNRKIGH